MYTCAAAKSMGFLSSPPPYLSLAPSSEKLVLTAMATGVSYASSGAGILDSTVSVYSTFCFSFLVKEIKITCAMHVY